MVNLNIIEENIENGIITEETIEEVKKELLENIVEEKIEEIMVEKLKISDKDLDKMDILLSLCIFYLKNDKINQQQFDTLELVYLDNKYEDLEDMMVYYKILC